MPARSPDGEWQEGSTYEALVFAAHHRLSNLTVLVDHNNLQGFGSTAEVASMSPLAARLTGFDIDVQVIDGHNIAALRAALGPDGSVNRLRVIVMQTRKGNGVSFMQDRMEWHYLPIDAAQYEKAIAEIENR